MTKDITVISDFSKTLTASTNPTTWSCLAHSEILGQKYLIQRDNLFNENHKHEQSGDIIKTKQWFKQHLQLMCDSELEQEDINTLVKNELLFKPRKGMKMFFHYLHVHSIQIKIITSGISNFVEAFLEYHNIQMENIQIIGNQLIPDSCGKMIGYNQNSIVTPLDDKGSFETLLNIPQSSKVYLLGDKLEDLNMYSKDCISIGFGDSLKPYNINFGKNGSLNDVIGILEKNYMKE